MTRDNPSILLILAAAAVIPVTLAAGLRVAALRTGALDLNPLPSWQDGPSKAAIMDFVKGVTTPGLNFVPVADRIAVFDNDGTLWPEQPVYVQFAFALDRVRTLAPLHPEWETTQPFKAVLDNNQEALLASGEKGITELVMATHSGNTTEEFDAIVRHWIATAEHPRFNRPYTELIYQPMRELIAYLKANEFKTYIVSGGGVEFMRPWTERVYGIPPEQVIGSTIRTRFDMRDGTPVLLRAADVDFLDDKAGKPVSIEKFIGRRPIFTAGNSDGDLQMLQWSSAGKGPHLGLIVHHTDETREWAYDRVSQVGRLDRALDEAERQNWLVIDMKQDWQRMYPFEL